MGKYWLALAVALIASCSKDRAPTAQTGELISGKPAPRVRGARLLASDVPSEAPLIGEAGTRPDGYPWRQPDKVKLLGLLRMRQFEALDNFVGAYQDAFEKDYHFEEWPDQATSAFYVADPALEPLLDEWIQQRPTSFAARLARGSFRQRLGWHYRGHAYARKTSQGQFVAMEEYFDAARDDFDQAVLMRPKLVAAYKRLIQMERAGKEDQGIGSLLGRALAQCELCFTPRQAAMGALLPRWGGSYELMREFVAQSSLYFGQNPRLRALRGNEDADLCDLLHDDAKRKDEKRAEATRKACEAALSHGDEPYPLLEYARFCSDRGDKAQALTLLDRALRIDAQARDVVRKRAYVRAELGDLAGAASDGSLARQLDPTSEDVTKLVEWLVEKIRRRGYELTESGQSQQAAQLLSLGLQLAPDDHDLLQRMGHSQRSTDPSAQSIEAQLAAAPDDFELRQRIDSGLAASHRYADVVTMWDAFILAHLKDPRAYWERAGAHWHLQQIDQALGDMQHACALGMDRACNDMRRMKAIAGR